MALVMPYLLARHRVRDYADWKALFDDHARKRKELGSRGGMILRNAQRPDEILVLTEWENLEKAREFTEWGNPEGIRRLAGVIDQPDLYFLDKVASVEA